MLHFTILLRETVLLERLSNIPKSVPVSFYQAEGWKCIRYSQGLLPVERKLPWHRSSARQLQTVPQRSPPRLQHTNRVWSQGGRLGEHAKSAAFALPLSRCLEWHNNPLLQANTAQAFELSKLHCSCETDIIRWT